MGPMRRRSAGMIRLPVRQLYRPHRRFGDLAITIGAAPARLGQPPL